MLNEANLLDMFCRELVYTVVYILNRGQLRVNSDKSPYELWYHTPIIVNHFKIFWSKCYIKKYYDDLGIFDSRTNE